MKLKIVIVLMFAVVFFSLASVLAEVNYPIAELGNCASQEECKIYCDDLTHIEACISIAEKYNLMSSAELDEIKKVLPFLKEGTTPGGCRGKEECESYCNREENLNECVEFAYKMGEISSEEYEIIKKTGGKGPGGCKGMECKSYCDGDAHLNECIDFAVQYGLIDPAEAEIVKKTGGKGPGGCKSKEECDNYCKDNREECKRWGDERGLVFEQNERGEGGPGGCRSEEECKAFCENPDNTQTCMEFSIKEGKLSQEEYNKFLQDRDKANQPTVCQCEEKPGQRNKGSNWVDGKCECYYEPIEVQPEEPPSYAGEGCTEPGPEGQCGSSGGENSEIGKTDSARGSGSSGEGGGESGGSSSGDSGNSGVNGGEAASGSSGGNSIGGSNEGSSDSGSSSSGGESSGSSGGEGGVTGGVIIIIDKEDTLLEKIYNYFR